MQRRIDIDDKTFLKNARQSAKSGLSIRAAAQKEGVSMQTYKNHLMDVAMRLQEVPPNFPRGKRASAREFVEVVRRSGQGGSGKRLGIPAEIFQAMGWEDGDQIRIRKSGKKVILEAYDPNAETEEEDDEE